jgi:hypothetical protein
VEALLGSPAAPVVAAMAVFNLQAMREQTVEGAPILPYREQVAVVGLGTKMDQFATVLAVAVAVAVLAL